MECLKERESTEKTVQKKCSEQP